MSDEEDGPPPLSTTEIAVFKRKITRQLNIVANNKAAVDANLSKVRSDRNIDCESDIYEDLRSQLDVVCTAVESMNKTLHDADTRVATADSEDDLRQCWEKHIENIQDNIFEAEDLLSHVKLALNRVEERTERKVRFVTLASKGQDANSDNHQDRQNLGQREVDNMNTERRNKPSIDASSSPLLDSSVPRSRVPFHGRNSENRDFISNRSEFQGTTADRFSSRSGISMVEPKFAKGCFNIELPIFDGDPTRWDRFWRLFKIYVHDQPYDELIKLSILQKFTTGDALDFIESESAEGTDYSGVIDALLDFYDDAVVKKSALYKSIENIPRAEYTAESISAMNRTLTRLLSALDKYESIDNMRMRREIKSKLPRELIIDLAKLERESKSEWSTSTLIKEIKEAIKLKRLDESLQKYSTDRSEDSNHTQRNKNSFANRKCPGPPKVYSGPKLSGDSCIFCGKFGHSASTCYKKISTKDASQKVRETKACRKCLVPGHRANNCKSENCATCRGDHHSKICFKSSTELKNASPQSGTNKNFESGLNYHARNFSDASSRGSQPFREGTHQ